MVKDNLIECVTIDNICYMIFDKLELNNNKYLYLIEEDNETNFCIRKIKEENEQEYIVNLDNKEEFTQVFMEFARKQKTAN